MAIFNCVRHVGMTVRMHCQTLSQSASQKREGCHARDFLCCLLAISANTRNSDGAADDQLRLYDRTITIYYVRRLPAITILMWPEHRVLFPSTCSSLFPVFCVHRGPPLGVLPGGALPDAPVLRLPLWQRATVGCPNCCLVPSCSPFLLLPFYPPSVFIELLGLSLGVLPGGALPDVTVVRLPR